MRTTKSRCLAPAGLVALLGALTLLALPGTSLAAAAPNADGNSVLLAHGAGYADPATAREVRVLQRKLRTLGWRPGPVDGMFGPRTEHAVVGFQRATGLVPDGIAGPRTSNALDRARQKPLARGAGYRPPAGSPRVRVLQKRLRGAGFDPGPVDGLFGPRTQAAVERLQRAGGLSADGIVSHRTRRLLAERGTDSRTARGPAAPNAAPDSSRTARGPVPERSRDQATRAGQSAVPTARAMRSTSQAIDGLDEGDGSTTPLLLAGAAFVLLAVSGQLLMRLFATGGGTSIPVPQGAPIRARNAPTTPSAPSAQSAPTPPQPSAAGEGSVSAVSERSVSAAREGSVSAARERSVSAAREGSVSAVREGSVSAARQASVTKLGPVPASGHDDEEEARKEPPTDGVKAIGYVSVSDKESFNDPQFKAQMDDVDSLCERRGWRLVELVRDKEVPSGKALDRPGLGYALERMEAGEASCLVVSKLRRLSHSVADIGRILEMIGRSGGRLVALDLGIDTATPEGRKAANVLLTVSGWERQRIAERTRQGLEAARAKGGAVGRPSVHDVPALKKWIVELRASGLTLQAIADRLVRHGGVAGGGEVRVS
jgi:DNA invertase Pin-like site-specific DNA recombinase/lysozyme family protein